jgi:hypothetical protein
MISVGGVREARAGQPRPVPTAGDPRRRHARHDPRSDQRERRQRRASGDRAVFLGEPRGGAVGADALPRDRGKPHSLLREARGPLGLPARLPLRPPRFRGGVGSLRGGSDHERARRVPGAAGPRGRNDDVGPTRYPDRDVPGRRPGTGHRPLRRQYLRGPRGRAEPGGLSLGGVRRPRRALDVSALGEPHSAGRRRRRRRRFSPPPSSSAARSSRSSAVRRSRSSIFISSAAPRSASGVSLPS